MLFPRITKIILLYRAAWYTAGMVGGLSTVAATAPSDKFLYMGGPLAMGFGVIFAASIASGFMNPVTNLTLTLHYFTIPCCFPE
jgi:FtsH-binding integral membrane protein